jgi:hypothetical protein
MDNKITLKRLKNFLIYDSIKLIACVVGVVFLLLIIFNAVAKKPTEGQDFYMLISDDVICSTEGYNLVYKTKNDEKFNFSYDVLRVNNMHIDPSGYTNGYLMNTYVELGEDDVFIASDLEGEGLYESYVKSNFAREVFAYVTDAKNYVIKNGFLNDDGSINVEKVRRNFISTRGKDTRFEKDADFEKGVLSEVERIKSIYENAIIFEKVLQNHPELLYKHETVTYQDRVIAEGYFALNLEKLNGKNENFISNAFTRCIVVNEELGTIEYTSSGIVLMFGNNLVDEGDLYFEGLAFVNNLINTYSTFIDELN